MSVRELVALTVRLALCAAIGAAIALGVGAAALMVAVYG